MKHRKLLAIGIVCAIAGLGAWAAFRQGGDVEYRTAPVERGSVASKVSASGNLAAVVTVQVGSQVSGNIQELHADFNTRVKKGQLVARIDPQIFQARVDQAAATLGAAQAAVGNAQAALQKSIAEVSSANATVMDNRANIKKNEAAVENTKVALDRRLSLASQGVLSREDQDNAQAAYDSAVAALDAARAQEQAAEASAKAAQAQVEVSRAQVASAQSQVKQAAAALEQARVDLNHTSITAPVDGVVVARQVDVGQTVAASLQAPNLFQIAEDLTKMEVDTNVSEADIGQVKMGQAANFTVDAYPGTIFHGVVSSIRKAPVNVQNVVTYIVVVTVDNPDLKLFPGMTANVSIAVERHDDVLKISNAALRFRPANAAAPARQGGAGTRGKSGAARQAGAGQQIWVLDEGSREPRAVYVKTGLTDGTYTEITGGEIKEGDRVVTAAISNKEEKPSTAAPRGRGPSF